MGEACSTYAKREMHTKFWSLTLKEKDQFRDLVIDREIDRKIIIK
jgi:hypothetical protein